MLFTVSLLAAGLLLDRPPLFGWSFVARLALIPIGVMGLFALELVTRYDLEKLSTLPLSAGWMRRPRDGFVAAADRLARALAPRRAA